MMVLFDDKLFDSLTAEAREDQRLRKNYDLRNSPADTSQRMLNAIEPGSLVPIHRHRETSETVVVLRGRVIEKFYDQDYNCEAEYELAANGPVCAINVPVGKWHSLQSLESGTVILEMKDGPYMPISNEDIFHQ